MRGLRPDVVAKLAISMQRFGMINPILVRPHRSGGYWLVVGWHRLEAAKLLNWTSIAASVHKMTADEALLAEIDSNLFVAPLSPAERLLLEDRKSELLQQHQPERNN
jgi:ParB family transcriptional regulator, chromosome partitioning protein